MNRNEIIQSADQLIAEGRARRSSGAAMKDAGDVAGGEQAMARGDEMILRGQKLKDLGLMTP